MDTEDTHFRQKVIFAQQNSTKHKFTKDLSVLRVISYAIDISLDVIHRQNLILIERIYPTDLINRQFTKTAVIVKCNKPRMQTFASGHCTRIN